MDDLVYVYTDESNIIYDISFKPRGDLVQHKLSMIPRQKAQELISIYEKWQQNENYKKIKYILTNDIDGFGVAKTVYIYYHFKEKNICSITPRKQQSMEEEESLRSGLIIADSVIDEFIAGTKNMLNYKVNDSSALLTIEEIIQENIEIDFLNNILLLKDYTVDKNNEEYNIEITYDGELLKIETKNKNDAIKYQLFFISRTDKTKLYETISFDFVDNSTIEIPLNIPEDYIVISSFNKSMKFDRIKK